ncbi:MAG: hypothetical protein ABSA63_08640 [Thermoplasmata archaeon]
MITFQAGATRSSGGSSPRHLLFGLTGIVVVLLVGVLFVPSIIRPMPVPQSELVPGASIPPWNNWTCNPNNPSPAALDIPVANPSVNQIAGVTFNVTYEFEVEGYNASDFGTTVHLPSTKALLPTAPTGDLLMVLPPKNVTVTGAGWSSPALLSKNTTLTSDEDFSTTNASLTTSKLAVMANATSGSLTLEFRWQWNFSSEGLGTNDSGNWSVPSLTATSSYLPSIFYPAPYVGIVSTTASPALAGTNFTVELNGAVNNTSFRVVLEYPNNGTEIQSIWENTSAHATLFNATVPLSYRNGVPLPVGNYEIHVHDVCEAIVQMHPVAVIIEKAFNTTFTETGLPSGTTWYVNGTAWGSLSATVAGTLGTSVSANLTNGSYSFSVASANKTWAPAYTSPFDVSGGPASVPVTFTEVTYAVTFTESGLLSGTTWYVNLTDGQSNSSTGSMIGFSEPNGTYHYAVATTDKKYSPTPSGGSFDVSGAPVGQSVTFNRVTYTVTFTETGLPSGTTWYVNGTAWGTLSATVAGALGTSVSASLANGTYHFTVASANKTWAPAYTSPFVVNGGPASVPVTFAEVTYAVTFTESGLPSGATWYVNITGGQSHSSTGSTIGFVEPNGTYAYTVASTNKTWAPAYTSPFVVNGGPVSIPVTFTEVTYAVTFTESGLPSGTTWYVNLTDGQSKSSTGTTIGFLEPNETYHYTVATTDKVYAPTVSGGSFDVSGAPVGQSVTFNRGTYPVTFTETGLPSGTTWYVNGTAWGSLSATVAGALGTSVSANLTNGTYSFTVASATKTWAPAYTSPFVVNGGPVSVPVTFTEVTYAVTFTESGLPSGTTWYVNLTDGQSNSSTGSTIGFLEPNGTYAYTVASANKTWAPAYTSPFVVNGGPVSEPVTFTEVTYSVTFTETGLPPGTSWTVTLNGTLYITTTTTITFTQPNGTYDYTVATSDTEYASAGGTFRVNGAVVSETVTFLVVKYTITFTETGLPPGTTWYVNITGGQSHSSTGTTISFSEPNGTYVYTVGGVPGWTSSQGTETVTVHGAVVRMPTITYSPTGNVSPGTGWWVWAIDGVVIFVVLAAAVVVVLSRRKPPATPVGSSSSEPGPGGIETEPAGRPAPE